MNEENKQENRTSPDADELFQELATSPAVQAASEVQKQLQDVTTSPVFLEIQKNLQALSSVTVSRPLQSAFDGVLSSLKGLQDVLASIDPKKLEQLKEEARILAADMMNGATLNKIKRAKASFDYWTTKCDEAKASLEQIGEKTRKPYTKKALVLNAGDGRPENMIFRNTSVLEYNGTIYRPTKAERYILDGFVYYNPNDKESVTRCDEVAELAKRTLSFSEWQRFDELRNVEMTVFNFAANFNNDVFVFSGIQDLKTELEKKKEKTDDEQDTADTLKIMFDVQRLRLEISIEAVEDFLKKHNVPPFLSLDYYENAKSAFLTYAPPVLLDTLKDTLNAKELRKMFDLYFEKTFE